MSLPFTKIPPSLPPRGSRRDWRERLTLPNRIDLYAHGLVERRIATYGFVVWDVGENRLIMEHGRLIAEGELATQLLADHRALNEGIRWLIRQRLHRRQILALTDSTIAYESLIGPPLATGKEHPLCVSDTRNAIEKCPQLTLRLIPAHRNSAATKLADDAYIIAQESKRRERASAVISELSLVRPRVYQVGSRYQVNVEAGTCTCPDFGQIHTPRYPIRCKHLLAAIELERMHGH